MNPLDRIGIAIVSCLTVLIGARAETIERTVISSGGGTVGSKHHTVTSAIGEGLIGPSTSEHHEITWGFFAFVGQPCATSAVCNDEDVCTFDACTNTLCAYAPVRYGDVNRSGASGGAAIPNLDDILCTLSGFADFARCPNADLAPLCTGDGVINLDDILATLGAFAGNVPCKCVP